MIDERAFIAQVEAATPEQFAELLRSANLEEQRALRAYFGDQRYDRLRVLALQQLVRGPISKRGNVVVLPGILGSELSVGSETIWFGFWSLLKGDFDQLQVDAVGNSVKAISAGALLRRYYGEIEQSLLAEWDVRLFPFDWRLSIRDAADLLVDKITEYFGQPDGVHLVAHSMGGLVSRALATRHPEVWKKMGRLVMLGTPNYGSFAIPQLYTGLYRLMRIVAAIDFQHDLPTLLQFAKMFVGTHQMLPRPDKVLTPPDADRLFIPATYGALQPPQARLDDARRFQQELVQVADPDRLCYVAGANRATAVGVADWSRLATWDGYVMTAYGDGTVPHSLGLLDEVRTFFVDEEHSQLPSNARVLGALGALLSASSSVPGLAKNADDIVRAVRGVVRGAPEDQVALRSEKRNEDDWAVLQAQTITRRMTAMRGIYDTRTVAPEEQMIADLAIAGQVIGGKNGAGIAGQNDGFATGAAAPVDSTASGTSEQAAPAASGGVSSAVDSDPKPTARLRVHVLHAGIEEVGQNGTVPNGSEMPVDALAVGHYVGVLPIFAELALDKAISAPASTVSPVPAKDAPAPENAFQGIITQFTERGIVRGELGRPYFLPDPRTSGRVAAIAGMGAVGRFGPPELTVVARELVWSLGRIGKRHLATVLIGSGAGNLETDIAVKAWLRGAARAIVDSPLDRTKHVGELTFVEINLAKAERIRLSVIALKASFVTEGLAIECDDPPFELPTQGPAGPSQSYTHTERPFGATAATRLLVELQREKSNDTGQAAKGSRSSGKGVFRFSAVTETASVPERDVRIDPSLAFELNDSLASEQDALRKLERGEVLFKALVPNDIHPHLVGDEPIVLACDTNVAQLHWELMVAPALVGAGAAPLDRTYLGLYPGITRQLRNTFSHPPEPPPPSSRTLRVLIIGDTAADAPLPGAATEAQEVQSLFEAHAELRRRSGSLLRIEVTALIGPTQATRANVYEKILKYPPFDILHYSGHCVYDAEDPTESGWIFTGGKSLSANELSRVDRVPGFVFSNACESGVTPSRLDRRSAELAPSFAESFFARGVNNFVCTAWPIADDAACVFARTLYSKLLGGDGERPMLMFEAMRNARKAISSSLSGAQTWGAYQHYGSPYFRLT